MAARRELYGALAGAQRHSEFYAALAQNQLGLLVVSGAEPPVTWAEELLTASLPYRALPPLPYKSLPASHTDVPLDRMDMPDGAERK